MGREALGEWRMPACREPSLVGPRAFRFLNLAGDLEEVGWEGPPREKLWRYNQHYFDDLNARDAASRAVWHRNLIDAWLIANLPGVGSGWEPYPTSLRMVNWIKWALAGHRLADSARHSLAVQARWLRRRLEWHLLGNHLFANAKALVFAGCLFEGDEASAWLDRGLSILAKQIPEQILADGGQFERSPMYHALALEDVLDLINLFRAYPGVAPDGHRGMIEHWPELAGRMLSWLRAMCHPDGEIGFFNDAAFGIAPDLAELTRYAAEMGIGCELVALSPSIPSPPSLLPPGTGVRGLAIRQLPESGYLRLEGYGAVALLDVAPIGPDYLPGHAHADTLSFELSLHGQRVVVNGGTSRYGLGPERLRERSTRAHRTVEVSGADSSEVWGGFRVARRAYPFDLLVAAAEEGLTVVCAHDGYRRLPGRPVHTREWRLSPWRLVVHDRVSGGLPAVARFLLHPEVSIMATESEGWALGLPLGQPVWVRVSVGHASVESCSYAPEFGKVLASQCLCVDLVDGESCLEVTWQS